VQSAYEKAREELLAERCANGHWIGELASSALATATAVSALSLVDREHYKELIGNGVQWILGRQNADGGWGDTEKNYSNISTTMLVVAALRLAVRAEEFSEVVANAKSYIEAKGGIEGLRRRYGKDKTFAVPILTNYALAGLVSWSEVSALPFEAACVPQSWYRFMQMPVVSYAIPALVAIGQARYFHRKPLNPITRLIRAAAIKPSLKVLQRMQPESGGYLEAVPLTGFVTMALAGTGRADHPVAQLAIKFLIDSVRNDGSWPIDTNLATWNTTLSLNALAGAGENVSTLSDDSTRCLSWLLSCQHNERHPFTGADPGGWGWSDLSGAVPDSDDTPGALLTLAHWHDSTNCDETDRVRISRAAANGLAWLIKLQNRNGGWPTFCRGWGKLPFDRSGSDLTAHALRAIRVWSEIWKGNPPKVKQNLRLLAKTSIDSVVAKGFHYLVRQQRSDGSWIPLWFGNQDQPIEENPVYGTAKVLLAFRDSADLLGENETRVMRRGLNWLSAAQNEDGGWGGGPAMLNHDFDPALSAEQSVSAGFPSSVEETALALEALLTAADDPSLQGTIDKGVEWLCCKVENNLHHETSPIGFYFAKLWYYERLYPLIFTVSALGQAIRRSHSHPTSRPDAARQVTD